MEDQRRNNLTFGGKGCRSGLGGFTNQNSRMVLSNWEETSCLPQLDDVTVKLNIRKCKYKYIYIESSF